MAVDGSRAWQHRLAYLKRGRPRVGRRAAVPQHDARHAVRRQPERDGLAWVWALKLSWR
jgi:hypothetical protein